MDQARGAIDAARAAGAEQFAADELKAATSALQRADDAVAQRDYRLALNNALDSREQAQNAARTAAATRAEVRGGIERTIAEVNALSGQVRAWVYGPASARAPRTRRAAQQAIEQATADVQKASSATQAGDYASAQRILAGTKEHLQKVLTLANPALAAQSSRPRK